MRLLLDTCTLLWFLTNDPKLSQNAKIVIEDPLSERWLSPVSLLEIAVKYKLGKLPLPKPYALMFPAALTAEDIHLLPLESVHIEPLSTMPLYHRDPFDRLIAATALVEGLCLVSAEGTFDCYGLNRLW
jgi:PIN domain nuclease of toxin-antitoxin system